MAAVQVLDSVKAYPEVPAAEPVPKALHFPQPMPADQAMRLPQVRCRAMRVAQVPTTVPVQVMLRAEVVAAVEQVQMV